MTHDVSQKLLAKLDGSISVNEGDTIAVNDEAALRGQPIDTLAHVAVFDAGNEQASARWMLWQIGQALGIHPSSIHELYMARGRGDVPADFTVPALNLRAMTYYKAQSAMAAAQKMDTSAILFEIARSEIGYTEQRPAEYISSLLAAAIKTGFRGPLYVQGDHFQISAARYAKDADTELEAVRNITAEAIKAGFYNIDIDTSTLVDLSHASLGDQQRLNYQLCAELTAFVRQKQPVGITISVGGEIGEVGGKNSTEPELQAFMQGYTESLSKIDGVKLTGMSKISIQTGTSHGGVVLPDGSIADVMVDFDTLYNLSHVAREKYAMAGAVQHGASTLPQEAFNKFAEAGACEVHLATGFQNIMYDNEAFPDELRREIYAYLDSDFAANRKPDQTDEQFHYKERKRALGKFKRDLWLMSDEARSAIQADWEEQFAFLFKQLNVGNTREMALQHTTIVKQNKPLSGFSGDVQAAVDEDTSDLAD